MREFRFEPAVLHLKVGEEVVLTIRNKGQVEHEWVIGRGVVNNQDEKGYRIPGHYESGMHGKLVIE